MALGAALAGGVVSGTGSALALDCVATAPEDDATGSTGMAGSIGIGSTTVVGTTAAVWGTGNDVTEIAGASEVDGVRLRNAVMARTERTVVITMRDPTSMSKLRFAGRAVS